MWHNNIAFNIGMFPIVFGEDNMYINVGLYVKTFKLVISQ